MNDSEKLARTQLFLAACADVRGETRGEYVIPYDQRRLVEALDVENAAGNDFAAQFMVLNIFSNPHSPDFVEGLLFCQAAGVAYRRYEDPETILIRLSPRQVGELSEHAEFLEARALAENYLRRIHSI